MSLDRSQFRQTTCFVFITVNRLWCSHFLHHKVSTSHLALVHTAHVLPWWGGALGIVHLSILLCTYYLSQSFCRYITLLILSHSTGCYGVFWSLLYDTADRFGPASTLGLQPVKEIATVI